jgi:hypothetical protein
LLWRKDRISLHVAIHDCYASSFKEEDGTCSIASPSKKVSKVLKEQKERKRSSKARDFSGEF